MQYIYERSQKECIYMYIYIRNELNDTWEIWIEIGKPRFRVIIEIGKTQNGVINTTYSRRGQSTKEQ